MCFISHLLADCYSLRHHSLPDSLITEGSLACHALNQLLDLFITQAIAVISTHLLQTTAEIAILALLGQFKEGTLLAMISEALKLKVKFSMQGLEPHCCLSIEDGISGFFS